MTELQTTPEPRRKPQTLRERRAQLMRIADSLLYWIEHGHISSSERSQALRNYQEIERTLESMDKRLHEQEVSELLLWSELKVEAEEAKLLEELEQDNRGRGI